MAKKSQKGVVAKRHLSDDRRHFVYYLPREHYVGITSQKYPSQRVCNLKQRTGMDITGWRVLQVFNTREEARHYENMWHSWLGANGININN